jgi:hypothetical protein
LAAEIQEIKLLLFWDAVQFRGKKINCGFAEKSETRIKNPVSEKVNCGFAEKGDSSI